MSNALETNCRPFVPFNPKNKKHRTYYAEFMERGTWGRCPVRFIVPDDAGDLVTMIQRSLVNYYTAKEFDLDK